MHVLATHFLRMVRHWCKEINGLPGAPDTLASALVPSQYRGETPASVPLRALVCRGAIRPVLAPAATEPCLRLPFCFTLPGMLLSRIMSRDSG